MTAPPDRERQERLTGLCTFLVQSPPFSAGDAVSISFRCDETDGTLLPLNATQPNESKRELAPGERSWGETVVLARATLAATGGQPRDSLNQPVGDYAPDALTLSDVRIVDRSPPWDEA